MNKNNKKTMRITTLLFTTFALASMISFTSCDTDETQTVATFSNLTMADEFDVEGVPNSDPRPRQ